jgi:hypothetical protein
MTTPSPTTRGHPTGRQQVCDRATVDKIVAMRQEALHDEAGKQAKAIEV